MAQYPFQAVLQAYANRGKIESDQRNQTQDNIAGGFQTIANAILKRKLEQQALESKGRELEATAYLGGKTGYTAPQPVSFGGSPVGTPVMDESGEMSAVPYSAQQPYYPQIKEILQGKLPQGTTVQPVEKTYNGQYFMKDENGNLILSGVGTGSRENKLYAPPKPAVSAEVMRGQKTDQYNNKQISEMVKYIDPSNSVRSAMGIAKIGQQRAQRLEALATAMPDGNLDKRQIEEIAIGLNSILQGSNVSAQQQVQSLVPKSLIGNVNGIIEWVQNEPRGLGQQEFVRRLSDTIKREALTMENQTKQMTMQRLAAFPHVEKNSPEEWENAVKSFGIDPNEYRQLRETGFKFDSVVPQPGIGTTQNAPTTGLSPEKQKRLEELRAKRDSGTLR